MLPPFIIEQIRKREERTHQEQPRLELPLEPMCPPTTMPPRDEDDKRGVIIVEL